MDKASYSCNKGQYVWNTSIQHIITQTRSQRRKWYNWLYLSEWDCWVSCCWVVEFVSVRCVGCEYEKLQYKNAAFCKAEAYLGTMLQGYLTIFGRLNANVWTFHDPHTESDLSRYGRSRRFVEIPQKCKYLCCVQNGRFWKRGVSLTIVS